MKLVPITTIVELGSPAEDGTPRLESTTKVMDYTIIVTQSLIDPGAVNIEIFPDEECDENPRLAVHLNEHALHDTRIIVDPADVPPDTIQRLKQSIAKAGPRRPLTEAAVTEQLANLAEMVDLATQQPTVNQRASAAAEVQFRLRAVQNNLTKLRTDPESDLAALDALQAKIRPIKRQMFVSLLNVPEDKADSLLTDDSE